MEASVKVRKRGVTLTAAGLQRLNTARRQAELDDNDGARFTLEELCDRTQLSLKTITKVLNAATSVDKQTLEAFFYGFGLVIDPSDYAFPNAKSSVRQTVPTPPLQLLEPPTVLHWGEAPDVSGFYGRDHELAQLYQWIEGDRCRLIGLLGMGGMGKTTLVTKVAQQLSEGSGQAFTHIIWRSLRNAPSLDTVLSEWLAILSARPETQPNLAQLITHLQNQRCLLVLDNVETILSSGRAGDYRPGYENYGELLRLLGTANHQSCLILTSREKMLELVPLEGNGLPVRCLALQGCPETAHQLIQVRGLQGTPAQQQRLCDLYSSSPLAIQMIAVTIRDLFDGDIGSFLQQDALLFSGLRRLLDQQFERLSPLEEAIMFWLAINREGCCLDDLRSDLLQPVTSRQLLEAIESLHWRCLIKKQSGAYTQQPVVMEYVTERLTEQVSAEILALRQPPLPLKTFLQGYALLKTTAKDYVRITQNRLVLEPICNLLQTTLLSRRAVVAHLKTTLEHYRTAFAIPPEASSASSPAVEPSYAAGNLLNLLCHLGADLSGIDVSGLAVWQAYLPYVPLPAANFAQADLRRSQLTERFGAIFAAVFTPDGSHFVTGELSGYLRCWDVSNGQVRWAVQACHTRIHDLAISPDGAWLAVALGDHNIQFWDIATGRLRRSLMGHSDQVYAVAFHPQTGQLASVSGDTTVRLWDIETGTCAHVFDQLVKGRQNHQLFSLCFSCDGTLLFSGDRDGTLKIWDLRTQQMQSSLTGHTDQVYSVAMHPQGQILASSSADGTVKLWDIATRELIHTLRGHSDQAISVRFSADGTLASSGSDATICLWDVQTGRLIQRLSHGHWVRAIAFSPNGRTLLSGCGDYSIKLWDVSTGNLLRTWSGYSNWFWGIAWS